MSDSQASSSKYSYRYFVSAKRPAWTKTEEPSKEEVQAYVEDLLGLKKKPDSTTISS